MDEMSIQPGAPAEIQAARNMEAIEYADRPLDLLWLMDWVLGRAKQWDRTPAQKQTRRWLEEDRKGFMARLADLKVKAMAIEAKAGVGEESAPDEGTEAALGRLGRWLEEHEK